MAGTFMKALVFLVALALLSRPAAAVEINSFIYAVGGTEVAGGSYTELDWDDILYDGASYAEVDSTLWAGEDQLDYEYNIDPVLAEDFLSGDGGWGTYSVLGDHWVFSDEYGWYYVGQSSAQMDLDQGSGGCGSAPACRPMGEYSTFQGPTQGPGAVLPAGYYGWFTGTLTGGNFAGDSISESVSFASQSCYFVGSAWAPASGGSLTGGGTVAADNTYPDTLGQVDSDVSNYYMSVISGAIRPPYAWVPYASCNLWVSNQAVYDSSGCDWWDPYKNNTLQYTIYQSTIWVTRDTAPGEIL
jgi:hypothetical protein